jgi:hypothetical protein
MKLICKFAFSLIFICSNAQSKTLENLASILSNKGTNRLVEFVESEALKISGDRYFILENEIREMSSQETLTPPPKWKISKLLYGEGVAISLDHGHHYFAKHPISILSLEMCPNNIVSSGSAYKKFKNNTLFSFSWSCGSAGCS